MLSDCDITARFPFRLQRDDLKVAIQQQACVVSQHCVSIVYESARHLAKAGTSNTGV